MNTNYTNQSVSLDVEWLRNAKESAKEGIGSLRPNLRVPFPKDVHFGDRAFHLFLKSIAIVVALLLAAIALFLFVTAWPSIKAFGFGFVTSSTWDPVKENFGALPVIFGTIVSSLLAILISTPVSVGVALFLTELAPRRVGTVVGFLVEMLAAIPSVVYGLWGIFVLAPLLRNHVEPAVGDSPLGILPLFAGPYYGVGMLASGLILAIMVTPTISAICREVFRAIPRTQREGALGVGATRWEMIRLAVLKSSRAGVFAAVVLGLGRALGETMAVTMLIGNRSEISASLFAPSQTMASVIANEYAEATSTLHLSALAEVGFCLFVVTFLVNGLARVIIWKVSRSGAAK